MKKLSCALVVLLGMLVLQAQAYPNKVKNAQEDQEIKRTESEDENELDKILKINENADREGDQDPQIGQTGVQKRAVAISDRRYCWPGRNVKYFIDTASGLAESVIQAAIDKFNTFGTCITWQRITESEGASINCVKFTKGQGCHSLVGKSPFEKPQVISIGDGCEAVGIVLHEMMHALGFFHTQCRPDRDAHVEIFWENVKPEAEANFKKLKDQVDSLNLPYDKNSAMQYGSKAFSSNGLPTIKVIHGHNSDLGQRNNLSSYDIAAINTLYQCSDNSGWSNWGDWVANCALQCETPKMRTRYCMGSSCPAGTNDKEEVSCTTAECNEPVNGHWTAWGRWGSCSKECGEGSKTRTRTCTEPAPKNGGQNCVGSSTETSSCTVKACNAQIGDCTFDDPSNPWCGWTKCIKSTRTSTQTKYLNWIIRAGSTPSSGTGPTGDHTTGTGNYAYADASFCGSDSVEKAKPQTLSLISPPLTGSSSNSRHCFSVWYNAYGSMEYGFQVFTIKSGLDKTDNGNYVSLMTGYSTQVPKDPVRGMYGDQGTNWHQFKMAYDMPVNYQIVIETTCTPYGSGAYKGDLAVDDIKITQGECS